MYQTKEKGHGERRHMGPEPHVVKIAMEDLKRTMTAAECTEKVVAGKLMEVKGKMVQAGITPTIAVNMTLEQYMKRIERFGPQDNVDTTQFAGYMSGSSPSPTTRPTEEEVQQHMAQAQQLMNYNQELAQGNQNLAYQNQTLAQENHGLAEQNEILRRQLKEAEDLVAKKEKMRLDVMSARPKSVSSPARRVVKDNKKKEKERGQGSRDPEESPSKQSVMTYHTTSESEQEEPKEEKKDMGKQESPWMLRLWDWERGWGP